MKKINIVILLVGLLLQTSCIPTYYSVKKKVNPSTKTKLIVIAGMFDEETSDFANILTNVFQKNSKFSMIPQSQLKRNNKHYPVRIKGPFNPSFFEIREDYGLTDKEKVLKYARSVKSDYVYVVWIPLSLEDRGSVYQHDIIGQMFDVRTGEEVGQGKYSVNWFEGAYIGWGAARTREEALKQGAGFAVKEITEKMGMNK